MFKIKANNLRVGSADLQINRWSMTLAYAMAKMAYEGDAGAGFGVKLAAAFWSTGEHERRNDLNANR